MTPKQDCERLLSSVMPFAETMLKGHGEFSPFGGYLKPDGEIVQLGAADADSDHPTSKDLIFILREAVRSLAHREQCDAAAVVFDVSIAPPGSDRKGDAIQVRLDHREGYSAEVFFPYLVTDGEVIYGETFAQQGPSDFLVGRPCREAGEAALSPLSIDLPTILHSDNLD